MKRTSEISDSESDSEETLNPKRARISDSNAEEENPLQFGEDG
jgi:hypothetical protein